MKVPPRAEERLVEAPGYSLTPTGGTGSSGRIAFVLPRARRAVVQSRRVRDPATAPSHRFPGLRAWTLVSALTLGATPSAARAADPRPPDRPADPPGSPERAPERTPDDAGRAAAERDAAERAASDGDEPNALLAYLEGIFGMPEDPSEPRFIAYPVLAYAPETDWEIGVSFLGVYYAGDDPRNRLSEVTAYAFATFAGQFGVTVEHALYTDRDQWFILGEGRFQSFPLQYYGIGPDTPAEPRAKVEELSLLIRERLLYKLWKSLYIGPELSFDLIRDVRFDFREGVEPQLPNGAEGSLNLGVGLGIVFDDRHNVLNVRDGLFSELAFLHYDRLWGSDFEFSVVESDTRYFIPINERDTLALQLVGRFSFGDVPFNELSTLGGESLMRGYYLGRFRDRHFVGAQVEYRFLPLPFFSDPFWRRFGASLFLGTGAVFPGPEPPPISDFVLAGGAGLRFLLFPDKDVYTRVDVAFTREGPTFYVLIGEAF